jgi:hypothetical protein
MQFADGVGAAKALVAGKVASIAEDTLTRATRRDMCMTNLDLATGTGEAIRIDRRRAGGALSM